MSWRDSIQKCDDVPVEVCNARCNSGDCDDCTIDRVLEALKVKGVRIEADDWPSLIYDETYAFYKSKVPSKKGKGWLVFIPDEEL